MTLPPDLRARVLAEVRREPSPTLVIQRRRVLVAACVGVAASVALSARLGLPSTRPPLVLLSLAAGGALFALAATWIAASRGASMLGRSRATLAAVSVLAPLSLLVLPTAVAALAGTVTLTGGTAQQNVICFVITLLFALGPFCALAYARRGSDPVHPRALGAALGAAAGAWGGVLIDVHCTLTTVQHFALGHVLPIAILALLGALVGGRFLGVRSPSR